MPTFLTRESSITFTGFEIEMVEVEGDLKYRMSQGKDLLEFLMSKGLDKVELRSSPMPDKDKLTRGELVSDELRSWCKSVIGGLFYYARGVRVGYISRGV